MLEAIKAGWRRFWGLNHYQRAALISLFLAFGLLIYALGINDILPSWYFDFAIVPAFVGSAVSGATYIARVFDDGSNTLEKAMTVSFIAIGLILSIVILLQIGLIATPFSGSIGIFAYGVFGIGMTSVFGGIGNRLASSMKSKRPMNERIAIGSSALIGTFLSIFLFIFAKTAMLAALGAATVFVPGASVLLPTALGGILFTVTAGSTLASSMDYVSKAYNYFKFIVGRADPALQQRITERQHEYRGSFVGVLMGIIVAVLISALMPHVVAGILTVAVTGVVFAGCCSILGGLCSHCGYVLDGFAAKKAAAIPAENPDEQQKLLTNTHASSDSATNAAAPTPVPSAITYTSVPTLLPTSPASPMVTSPPLTVPANKTEEESHRGSPLSGSTNSQSDSLQPGQSMSGSQPSSSKNPFPVPVVYHKLNDNSKVISSGNSKDDREDFQPGRDNSLGQSQ